MINIGNILLFIGFFLIIITILLYISTFIFEYELDDNTLYIIYGILVSLGLILILFGIILRIKYNKQKSNEQEQRQRQEQEQEQKSNEQKSKLTDILHNHEIDLESLIFENKNNIISFKNKLNKNFEHNIISNEIKHLDEINELLEYILSNYKYNYNNYYNYYSYIDKLYFDIDELNLYLYFINIDKYIKNSQIGELNEIIQTFINKLREDKQYIENTKNN